MSSAITGVTFGLQNTVTELMSERDIYTESEHFVLRISIMRIWGNVWPLWPIVGRCCGAERPKKEEQGGLHCRSKHLL